jgi:hypothetical protein
MRRLSILWAGPVVLSLMMSFPIPATAQGSEPPIVIGYEEEGVNVGAENWILDPATGQVVPAPPGFVSEDPNQFRADPQCQVDDQSLAIKCLPGQM